VTDGCLDLMEIVAILLIPTLLKAASRDSIPENLIQPNKDLIQSIWKIIVHDTTGHIQPEPLTTKLIKRILFFYGESDLACNEDLLDEMLLSSILTKDGQNFTVESFTEALTHDIGLYDIRNESSRTTTYDDVFLTKNHRDEWQPEDEESTDLAKAVRRAKNNLSVGLERRYTAAPIDFVANSYRSKALTVTLLSTFVLAIFGPLISSTLFTKKKCESRPSYYDASWTENSDSLRCGIGAAIINWLITFVVISVVGLVTIGLGSIGNDISSQKFYFPLFGMSTVFGLIVWTAKSPFSKSISVAAEEYLKGTTILLGVLVMLFHLSHAMILYVPKEKRGKFPRLESAIESDGIRNTVRKKRATAYKINMLSENALSLVVPDETDDIVHSYYGKGLLAFSKYGKRYEEIGFVGLLKLVYKDASYQEEGVFISARVVAANISQYVVALFILIAGVGFTIATEDQYSKNDLKNQTSTFINKFLDPTALNTLVNQTVANISAELSASSTACKIKTDDIMNYVNATANAAIQNQIDSIFPSQQYMITIPIVMGTIAAFLTALSLAFTYLPSTTATILKLRSGVIPTFRAPRDFQLNRRANDEVTMLIGGLFWGCFISSVLVGLLIAVTFFLLLWQVTMGVVQQVFAFLIGFLVVFLLKLTIVCFVRCTFYQAFYRRRPAAANIAALALECANLALSVGFVFLRAIRFIVSGVLFIGRIDTPFLASGVGRIGNFELDHYPTIFTKDLLAQEAHGHPYIDLLGVMYLMKLRYGEHFGSRAGSTWRLIFVYALMPWLHKYRVLTKSATKVHIKENETIIGEESHNENEKLRNEVRRLTRLLNGESESSGRDFPIVQSNIKRPSEGLLVMSNDPMTYEERPWAGLKENDGPKGKDLKDRTSTNT